MTLRAIAFVGVVLLTLGIAPGAKASDEFGDVRLRVVNGAALLTSAGRPASRDFSALTLAASIERVTILSRRVVRGVLYLVARLEGPSLRHGGMSMCGAGSEGSIVWLKVFPGLLVTDERSILIDSCFLSMESLMETIPGKIRIHVNSAGDARHFEVDYDESAAERGLTLSGLVR